MQHVMHLGLKRKLLTRVTKANELELSVKKPLELTNSERSELSGSKA